MYKHHNDLTELMGLQGLLDFFLASSSNQKQTLAALHLGRWSWLFVWVPTTVKGHITRKFWNYKRDRWRATRLLQTWDDFVHRSAFSFHLAEEAHFFIYFHSLLSFPPHYHPLYSLLFAQNVLFFVTPSFVLVQTLSVPHCVTFSKLFCFSLLVSTLKQKESNEYLYKE